MKKINFLKVAEIVAVTILVFAPLLAVVAVPETTGAQSIANRFQCDPSSGLNCENLSVNQLIRRVINWLLGIAFGVAVLFLIVGGFWYITAAGNEETAEKGRGTVINALIGIVIIILSYVIVNVVARLVTEQNTTP